MKKILLSIACITGVAGVSYAQCEAVASFDENFDTFTTFPENCWTSNGIPGMTFGIQEDEDDTDGKEILFYGFSDVGSEYIMASPELTSINGNHYLTFDGTPVSALVSGLKVQIGTLESNSDFTTFVPHGDEIVMSSTDIMNFESINIPSGSTHKYVAVKFTTSAPHQSLRLDNFKWNTAESACDALSTFNESFETFTAFPENCWTSSSGYPFIMFDDEPEDKSITFYALSAADHHYINTPELSTINGEYRLRFKATKGGVPGPIHVQIGTLTDNTDVTTFISHGAELEITATEEAEYYSISIPATAGHKYVSIRIKATADHQSLDIDDIVWEEQPSTDVENTDVVVYSLFPNPGSDVINIQSASTIQNVVVYNIAGQVVLSESASSQSVSIDASALRAGTYFIKISTQDNSSTVSKFIKL